jgi:hypothetical protein
VRIDGGSWSDLRIRLVDDAGSADFVMVDEPGTAGDDACNASTLKTVRLVGDDDARAMTVGIVRDEPADLRLFVRSSRFSQTDAAALLAAMTGEQTASIKTTDLAAVR